MDLDGQCLEIMCLPFFQDKYELKSCWSTKCWWKHYQSDQVVVDEMIKAWLCLSLQTNHRYTRVTQVFTSYVYFLKIFASRSFFEMISIQYLWKIPLQFWVYFDCNDTFRSPEEFKAIDWDYLDLCHYHRVRQKQRRGVLWIKALIWHKLQLSVYKWSSDTGTNIVVISHNRHNRRWCTFSCMEKAWFWGFFGANLRTFLACLLQCTMCSLKSIFFRATEQPQTYLKFSKILSYWTYIFPSLFECAERTLF